MERTGANTLVVMGIGCATVTPEVADLTIRLEATGNTPGAALGKVTAASQAVLVGAQEHGVPQTDLRTHGVSVYPQADPHGRRIIGYVASHVLRLRLTQISVAPTVIDTVTEAAGDTLRLEGFQLSSPDTTTARSDAAASAVADARGRAERLAEAAGTRLGPVISIVEEPTWQPGPWLPSAQRDYAAVSGSAAMPIQAGTDEITARVTVTFQITN